MGEWMDRLEKGNKGKNSLMYACFFNTNTKDILEFVAIVTVCFN